jgi:hypothetical protein
VLGNEEWETSGSGLCYKKRKRLREKREVVK